MGLNYMILKNLRSLKDIIKSRKNNGVLIPLIQSHTLTYGSIDPDSKSLEKILEFVRIAEQHPRDNSLFHPSGVYACMRAQLLNVFGYKGIHDIDIKRDHIFDDGKWRHLRWQTIFYRMGILHDAEIPVKVRRWRMVGSADAIVKVNGELVLVELKGAANHTFNRLVNSRTALESHIWQALCYILALRLMGVEIAYGVIFYENKDNQEIYEYILRPEEHQVQVANIKHRFETLVNSYKSKVLTGFECSLTERDQKFRYCAQAENCLKLMRQGEYPHDERNERIVQARRRTVRKKETRIKAGKR